MVEIRKHIYGRTWNEITLEPPDTAPHRNFWKYTEMENDYHRYPQVIHEDLISPEEVATIIKSTLKAIAERKAPMILVVNNKVIARNF